jgi:hypothetical protein
VTVAQAIRTGDASPPTTPFARALIRPFVPVTFALGLKDLLARGRRALLLAGAIALTGAVVVVALSLEATLDARPAGEVSDVPAELPILVYTLDAVLLVITLTTLVAVALLAVRERIRDYNRWRRGTPARSARSTTAMRVCLDSWSGQVATEARWRQRLTSSSCARTARRR